MLILAIDTSTRTGSVAFLRDGSVLDQISGYEETPYSTRLFRDLEVLQSRSGFSLAQIDVFAVVAGPGSFTGLRIGLTAVKGWAEIHGKPIAAISGLEAIAAQARPPEDGVQVHEDPIVAYLDARRAQVFSAVYRRPILEHGTLEAVRQETVHPIEDFLQEMKDLASRSSLLLVSPTPEVLPTSVVSSILPVKRLEKVSAVLAPVAGQLAFGRATRGELIDALRLDANYVRRSDAENAWKEL